MKTTVLILNYLFLLTISSFAQKIKNPSFEGRSTYDANIDNWIWCNSFSTPDLQPNVWNVTTPPQDGNTYVGLTCRSDGSWESIAQQLNIPFKAGNCYKMSCQLALSDTYAGYNKPTRLRIWGSNSINERGQLLASSPTIAHNEWRSYEFSFVVLQNWQFIIVECYYKEPTLVPYRGNILLDNIQAFFSCDRA
jgi:hypothetical protein